MIRNAFSRSLNRIIINKSNDPLLNLSRELVLLETSKKDDRSLYLWQNSPVVVIGKNQNPFKECNLKYMNENNIKLARRPTGGGAVYQDLGNSCWTFVSREINTQENFNYLRKTLEIYGIKANTSGRNDLEVDGKKISGSAFRKQGESSIHHGTMLLSVDTHRLTKSLTVDKSKLDAKGVDSVRSRVMNLCSIIPWLNHEKFCKSLVDVYQQYNRNCEIVTEDTSDLLRDPLVKEKYELLSSDEWLYGECSDANVTYSKKFDWGLFDIKVVMEDGKFKDVLVYTDCLLTDFVDEFKKYLREYLKGDKYLYHRFINESSNPDKAKLLMNWINLELSKSNIA